MSESAMQEPMKSYLYGLPDQFSQCLQMSFEEVKGIKNPTVM